jgi:hypothetical protein
MKPVAMDMLFVFKADWCGATGSKRTQRCLERNNDSSGTVRVRGMLLNALS